MANSCIYIFILLGFGGMKIFSASCKIEMRNSSSSEVESNEIDVEYLDEIYFDLFTKSHPDNPTPISIHNSSDFLKKVFRTGQPTKVVVHGWLGSEASTIVTNITKGYVATLDVNAVRVGWSDMAGWKTYPVSAWSVSRVGAVVAALVDHLIASGVASTQSVHLIGHSLGAHVMGTAGSCVRSGKVSRITGLDPARPAFEYISSYEGRLDPSDAEFVDVIHSAGGSAGFYSGLGHADFYPNGGTPPQPGCFSLVDPLRIIGCSHSRSYEYFIESISNRKGFRAVACDSWSSFTSGACNNNTAEYMGDPTPVTARGSFYLSTNSQPPYGQN